MSNVQVYNKRMRPRIGRRRNMGSPNRVIKTVEVLHRRIGILTCLLEEPKDKRTLVEELDIPRSTLDRAIRELESIDIVFYDDGKYTVTPIGERLGYDFVAFLERIEVAIELEPFLQLVPVDEFTLDLQVLADAELVVPADKNPYAMINRHVQRLGEAEQVRAMLPVVGLHGHQVAHERVVENGAEDELIVEPDVADVLISDPQFAELTKEMLATGRFDLLIYDGPIPYFVGTFDNETVQIGVDEDGEPRALVETERKEVHEWAHHIIMDYKQQATPITQTALYDQLKA